MELHQQHPERVIARTRREQSSVTLENTGIIKMAEEPQGSANADRGEPKAKSRSPFQLPPSLSNMDFRLPPLSGPQASETFRRGQQVLQNALFGPPPKVYGIDLSLPFSQAPSVFHSIQNPSQENQWDPSIKVCFDCTLFLAHRQFFDLSA